LVGLAAIHGDGHDAEVQRLKLGKVADVPALFAVNAIVGVGLGIVNNIAGSHSLAGGSETASTLEMIFCQ